MDQALHATLSGWRRHLHANPRVTLDEGDTAAFVVERLRELGVERIETGIGGHGVVATLSRGASNRSVALRADMDALPITEETPDLPWRSTKPGVMHACGHDGHTTALLGAAALLLADTSWSGSVHLVFQPAEEGGRGARSMVADGLFRRFPAERVFGWHNWPGLPAGTIAVHDHAVMAAGSRLLVRFDGTAGHAALPHLTRDPMVAAAHFVVAAQSVVARGLDPVDTGVVSLTMIEGGMAQNQIASRVTIRGTMRHLKPATGVEIAAQLRRIADGVAQTYGVEAFCEFPPGVQVTANDPVAREIAAEAAASVSELRRDLPPAMTGEDFSDLLAEVPGAFVWIGNGPAEDGRELHSPRYDFNDAILPAASGWLAAVAKRSLGAA